MADVTARGPNTRPRKRPPARPPRGRSGVRAALGICGHIALLLLTLVIVTAAACGMVYVRLQHGPISLTFLSATIQKGINAELSGFETRMDGANLALNGEGVLELRLTNLRLSEPDGDVVATVPTAAVELSRPALWAMKIVPARIDLIEPRLFLFYSEEGGLALSFVRQGQDAPIGPLRTAGSDGTTRRVDLSAMLAEATQRARKRLDASSYLNQIGVRDAVLTLDNGGMRSQWRIVEGAIELDHRKRRSIASGHATIASDRGPWTITMRSEESEKSQNLAVEATVTGLVPRTLGLAVPQLSLLETLDAPVSGQATLDIQSTGSIAAARLAVGIGRGQFIMPALAEVPFDVDAGAIAMTYDGATQRFDLQPSKLAWGDSSVSFAGTAVRDGGEAGRAGWLVDIATSGGQLTAPEFGVRPIAIAQGLFKARIVPAVGELRVDQMAVKAGGAEITGSGMFLAGAVPGAAGARFDARIGPMAGDTLKILWPRALATGARSWVGERVKRGTVKGGTVRFASGVFARDAGVPAGAAVQRRFTLAMEAMDVQAAPLRWLAPVEAPRALIRLEDNAIEINVPDATLVLAPTRRIPVKAGRFTSTNLDQPISTAEVSYKVTSPLVPVLEVLDQSPLRLLKSNGLTTEGLDGKVDGQMKLTLPLISDLDVKDVKIEVKAKVVDGRAKQLAGAYDVQSGAFAIDVTEASVTAAGDMLVNGVPVKLGWQRILEETGDKQPPLRLSATLDNADRTQLGIDINHILQGEVPVEVLIEKGTGEEPQVRFRADLTNADIALESIAWHKPPGRTATLQADVVKGKTYKFELQNLRVAGDDIAIEGSAGIGADNKLREVNLPGLSLNVITRLELLAVLKDGGADKAGIWQVKVKGQNFDARDMFRSLFSVGPGGDKATKPAKPSAGVDVEAEIDNVIGHSEVSLRNLKFKMSRRADKITFIEARGTLDGGGPVAISMNPQVGEPRRLLADTTDAGQAFKLIGFYPNMQVGRARLEVNVDGRGAAEKTGVLWVEDFRVLGDPIVAEVLGSAVTGEGGSGKPVRGAKGKVAEREVFQFDLVKVPFAVGCGQFVMENAALRGPLLGVTLVGKADFKQRTLNLGGTYIPLQGLNNAFGAVPGIGALASGPQNDGAFGITFAVQGPMAAPQVLVNPLSIIAPGIFRELFQMTNPNPKVSACDDKGPVRPVEQRVRSSATAESERAKGTGPAARAPAPAQPIDGWAIDQAPQKPAQKK